MSKKVIFILGTGHCVSTLLDLILGSHSACFSLGEVYKLQYDQSDTSVCDLCEDHCKVWPQSLLKKLQHTYQHNYFKEFVSRLNPRQAMAVKFYDLIQDQVQKPVLIDSSKKVGWINRNAKALAKSNTFSPVLIYLSRDGRAVVNSYYRKYPQRGLDNIAINWNKRIKNINDCYNNWDYGPKMTLRYKDFTQNPVGSIQQLLGLINLPYEPQMMRFWEHEHHLIGGNAGTKSMVLKFQKQHLHKDWIKSNNKGYYKNHELGIKFDERWKTELQPEQIETIEHQIGHLNKALIE